MKLLNKIFNDTLKSPNGKYSRKSLTMLSSWVMALLTGVYIVISDYFLEREINQYAINVFYGFLLLAGGTTAVTVYDKLKNGVTNKSEDTDA